MGLQVRAVIIILGKLIGFVNNLSAGFIHCFSANWMPDGRLLSSAAEGTNRLCRATLHPT